MECSSWISVPGGATWPVPLRAALYCLGLLYCFLGLGTITHKYMDAMEAIVSHTRTVARRDKATGQVVTERVKVWNTTIADITLLALGTSAPAISLSIIAAVSQLGKTNTGPDVGTGTMFGGAAFNFFCILACCILIPKKGSIKRVANFGVFLVELIWSIWAYVWLFIVLQVWTPNKVTVLESCLTVLHMPLLMIHAYAQDRHCPVVSFPRSWTSLDLTHQPPGDSLNATPPPTELPAHDDTWQKGSGSELVRPSSTQRLQEMSKSWEYVSDEEDGSCHNSPATRQPRAGAVGDRPENSTEGCSSDAVPVFRKVDSDGDLSTNWEGSSMSESRFSSVESGLTICAYGEGSVHTHGSVPRLSDIQEVDVEKHKSKSEAGGTGSSRHCSVDVSSVENKTRAQVQPPSVWSNWGCQVQHAVLLRGKVPVEGRGPSSKSSVSRRCASVAWRLLCYFWNVLFALVLPPTDALGGWAAFLMAIAVISVVAALVIELTNLLGCVIGLDSFLLSITLLAAGTSIPNVIASAIAAKHFKTADSAIANISASNCINVYLGLGIPWIITTVFNQVYHNTAFSLAASTLGPSLIVYLGTVSVGLVILLARRWLLGGELGGCRHWALASSLSLLLLWVLYCTLSILVSLDVIW